MPQSPAPVPELAFMPSPCTGSIAAAMNCVWTLWNFGSFAMPDELKAKNSSPWHMRALSAAIAEVAASWRDYCARIRNRKMRAASSAPSRQGRLLPIHPSAAPDPSAAPVNRAEQYWVERQTRAVAGFGQPPQSADSSSRPRMTRGQQLLYSRGSTPSASLLLPRPKSNFSLSGSGLTCGAALDVPTLRRREARRGPEAQHRLEVQHRLERHHRQRGDGYTSIGCLQVSKPTPISPTFFNISPLSLPLRATRRTP